MCARSLARSPPEFPLSSPQATRAAVQLFNAVREHQSDVRSSLQTAGSTEAKRERIEKQHASSLGFLERLEKKRRQDEPEEGQVSARSRGRPQRPAGSAISCWIKEIKSIVSIRLVALSTAG